MFSLSYIIRLILSNILVFIAYVTGLLAFHVANLSAPHVASLFAFPALEVCL